MQAFNSILSQGGNLLAQAIYRKRQPSTLTFMEKLNRIDDIRGKLLPMKKEKSFDEIFSNIPQFIVVGPQSSGKSSVLRRITGINLPISSGVCTRVPVVIKLRRGPKMASVDLVHPDGTKQSFENSNLPENISGAITKAQQRFRDKGEFGKDFLIDVLSQDIDKPNITLVDLPGFTTSSDENTEIVEEMVKKFLDMNGTLVLHIVRADQDYDSLLGNGFIRKHQNDRVLVLTHCDSLESQGITNYTQRMDETMAKNIDNIFAVMASKNLEELNNEDEVNALSKLNCLNTREKIKLGTKNLYEFIEKRMEHHLENQIPLLRDFMIMMKLELEDKLGAYDDQAPHKALVETLNILRSRFNGKIDDYIHGKRFRQHADDLKNQISRLYVFEESALTLKEGPGTWRSWVNPTKNKEYIQDIKEITEEERGLVNVQHLDTHKFIERYSSQFADLYEPILVAKKNEIFADMKQYLEETFDFEPSPLSTEFLKKLKQDFFRDYNDNDALICIEQMVLDNKPPLVFTENTHYLNQIYADMTEEVSFSTEDGAYLKIIFEIQAYIKTAKKVLYDISFKRFYQTLVKKANDSYENMLSKGYEKHITLIKLPEKMLAEKQRYEKQYEIVSSVLNQLNEM